MKTISRRILQSTFKLTWLRLTHYKQHKWALKGLLLRELHQGIRMPEEILSNQMRITWVVASLRLSSCRVLNFLTRNSSIMMSKSNQRIHREMSKSNRCLKRKKKHYKDGRLAMLPSTSDAIRPMCVLHVGNSWEVLLCSFLWCLLPIW